MNLFRVKNTNAQNRSRILEIGGKIACGEDKILIDDNEYEYEDASLFVLMPDHTGKIMLETIIYTYAFLGILLTLYLNILYSLIPILSIIYLLSLFYLTDSVYRKHLKKVMVLSVNKKVVRILPVNNTYSILISIISQKGGSVEFSSIRPKKSKQFKED